jgi:hypothetical protein
MQFLWWFSNIIVHIACSWIVNTALQGVMIKDDSIHFLTLEYQHIYF